MFNPLNLITKFIKSSNQKELDRIGKELNREPKVNLVPPHPADVLETWSNTNKLQKLGYQPMVDIEEGVAYFMEWYKDYMEVN